MEGPHSNSNKKLIVVSLIVAIIAIALILAFLFTHPTGLVVENKTLKIGILTPLTGFGDLGVKMQRGSVLAIQELNSQSNSVKIDPLVEDEGCDPKKALSALKKLVEIDDVHIIVGPLCSSSALAVAPYAEETHTLIMNGGLAPKLRTAGDYIFRPIPGAEIIASQQAQFALNTLNAKRVAFLYANNDLGVGYTQAFREEAQKLGIQITNNEKFAPTDTDYRTQIIKIKDSPPDAIVLVAGPKEMGLAIKQLKELGVSSAVLMPPSAESPDLIKSGGDSTEGVIYAYGYNSEASSGPQEQFIEDYKLEYNEDSSWHAAVGYDAVKIYYQALQSCNPEDTECIKNNIYSLSYSGAQGSLHFDSYGDSLLPITFKTVKNGKFVNY